MPGTPLVSIVVPAYNEARRIGYALERTAEYVGRQDYDMEVLISDDGSADDTAGLAAEFARGHPWIKVLTGGPNRGKGHATRRGVMASTGTYVGYMDADYKTPIEELDHFLPVLRTGADLVIGSRAMAGATIERAQPLYRRLGSRAFGAVLRAIMDLPGITDTQCGFKFFQRAVAIDLFSRQVIDGYMFDVEILSLSRRLGYRIHQIPIRWQNDPDSRYRVVSGTIRNAVELLRIRARTGRAARRPVPVHAPE